ncbi:MAG: hypothetical protein ABIP94_14385 [Planctomycetota bacterium]
MTFTAFIHRALPALAAVVLMPINDLVAQTKTLYGVGCYGLVLDVDELPDVTTAPFNFQLTGIPPGSVANA